MKEFSVSVTEYAKSVGLTRQAVLRQIKDGRLPKGVSEKKIGKTYVLFVSEKRK